MLGCGISTLIVKSKCTMSHINVHADTCASILIAPRVRPLRCSCTAVACVAIEDELSGHVRGKMKYSLHTGMKTVSN